MALADPQSVTIGGSAISLPRTGIGTSNGVFTSSDGLVRLTISHQATGRGRWRRTVKVEHAKVAADPFSTTANTRYSMSAYIVIDVPQVGYDITQSKDVVVGLLTFLTASTNANLTKALGGEV